MNDNSPIDFKCESINYQETKQKKNSTQHRWLPTKSYIDLSTAFYRLYEQAAAYSLLLGWQLQTGAA